MFLYNNFAQSDIMIVVEKDSQYSSDFRVFLPYATPVVENPNERVIK